ncbi:MAG: glycosyltransferase family 2 protein [Steroidobacteraceae bacterium]
MSQSAPRVGLGMPVYNGERFLARALDSVLAQTLTEWELVICDNASTDGTREICERYAAKDARIRYVRNAENLGAHPNYNLCFRHARGEYFKWVPHDDELHEDYLLRCVAAMDGDSAAILCQTDFEYIDERSATLSVTGEWLEGADSDRSARRFAAVILLPHTCYDVMGLFRREVLAASILLPSFHGADRALLADLALRGRFIHVDEPLLRVRDHRQRYTRAKTRPADRAVWHDTRNRGKVSLPTWRLYATYWGLATKHEGRWSLAIPLFRWWLVNWNLARAVVDLVATVAPGAVSAAEAFKQRTFSAAPGVDRSVRSKGG